MTRDLLSWALSKAKTLSSRDGALARVAAAYAGIENWATAVQVAQLIENPPRRIAALLRIAAKCADAEQLHALASLVVEEIKAAQYDPYSKAEDLKELASLTHEKLDFPDLLLRISALVVELAEALKDPEHKARVLAELASITFAATAQQDKALEILSDAVRVGKTIQPPENRNEALAYLVASFVEVDLNNEALELINETRDVASIADTKVKIAARYLKKGQTDKALEILRETVTLANTITGVIDSSWTLKNIAIQFAHAGQYVKALQAANAIDCRSNRIEPILWKALALVEIADKCGTAGQTNMASQVLSEALQAAKAIGSVQDGAIWSTQALEAVANRYAELGQYGQAFDALQAIEIRPPNPHISAHLKSVGLAKLADLCAKAKNKDSALTALSEALQTVRLIRDDNYCVLSSWAKIAASYALLGEKTASYHVLSQLVELSVDNDLKVYAVVEVIQRYLEVRQELDETAIETLHMMTQPRSER